MSSRATPGAGTSRWTTSDGVVREGGIPYDFPMIGTLKSDGPPPIVEVDGVEFTVLWLPNGFTSQPLAGAKVAFIVSSDNPPGAAYVFCIFAAVGQQ